MLRRFFRYFRPHRKLVILDLAAALLASFCEFLYPIFTRTMLYTLVPQRALQGLLTYTAVLLAVYLVRLGLQYFMVYYGHLVGVRIQADMRRELFSHLQRLPFSFYDNNETGNIMSRMINDLFDISELAHHGPENLFTSAVTFVGAFAYLSSVNLKLTLIIFAAVPILVFFSMKMRRRMEAAFMETKKEVGEINATLENSVSGIRVAKAFTNEAYEKQKFERNNAGFVKARGRAYKTMAQFQAGSDFIVGALNVLVLTAGGILTMNGEILYPDLIAFMLFVNLFISPIRVLVNFMEQYQDGMAGFRRYTELMDVAEEEEDAAPVTLSSVRGEIDFEDVSFGYGGGGDVLRGVDLHIPAGTTLALVGPSGGGKTTICHLIPRFYRAEAGKILLDGVDINHLSLDALRQAVGIVQQDVFLFNGTIRENIAYGRLGATEEEIIEAAKAANLYDFIGTLPDGLDTHVGERGVKLSGGQKQRISIARVFLKNPPVLILDEATSALDNTTEALIQGALDRLARGRTTVVVAHRLSTVRSADEIAVVSEGLILEKGTHDELMKKENGAYRTLYNAQLRGNG